MKKGFTMIELIFVIVILGILAAVALPRLTNTAEDAKKTLVEDFVGTLNRTVGPGMWAHAMRNSNGSIKGMTEADFKKYVDVPSDIGTITLANCAATPSTAMATATIGGKKADIYCQDGTKTSSPRFAFDAGMTKTVLEDSLLHN